ncbi:MAG TPA: Hsp20/alpha crystallin family protein [Caldisericia bacterium]|nr:Hsp20/alpha crystallin family protein [Caldisericia bacterium]HPF49746.1 Hsp20/alpha crystallin family protein [Caldisericia bacterium]HPI84308.1 Hsp20/alpha crystallin family protein [Caldisericia bacterium]HPQ93735.1 Hsp20/alpha crystallin family protein [Caldisericia bacterium]HRV74841.1 Hsp20/alpha crystallin family protein [Caldisericia bacterium]
MAIIKFDPVRNPLEFANEINRRVMRDLYGENGNAWRPSLDVSETNDSYVVKAEVPGVLSGDIDIEVHDDVLTVTGERKEEKVDEKEEGHVKEIFYGKFSRSIRLPMPIEVDDVKAKFENGILKVTLPKSEKVKPRKIAID